MTHSCVTWLIHVWRDSFMCDMTHSCVTWLIHVWHDSSIWDMAHLYVTRLIDMGHKFDEMFGNAAILAKRAAQQSLLLYCRVDYLVVTYRIRMWHNSFVTYRIRMWHNSFVTYRIRMWHNSRIVFVCDITHSWRIVFVCDITHVSYSYVTWLIHTEVEEQGQNKWIKAPACIGMWHDWHTNALVCHMTHIPMHWYVTWLTHMGCIRMWHDWLTWDMTRSRWHSWWCCSIDRSRLRKLHSFWLRSAQRVVNPLEQLSQHKSWGTNSTSFSHRVFFWSHECHINHMARIDMWLVDNGYGTPWLTDNGYGTPWLIDNGYVRIDMTDW